MPVRPVGSVRAIGTVGARVLEVIRDAVAVEIETAVRVMGVEADPSGSAAQIGSAMSAPRRSRRDIAPGATFKTASPFRRSCWNRATLFAQ
jgi:hypothetical protein